MMKRFYLTGIALFFAFAGVLHAEAPELSASWKKGIRFSSSDGNFELAINGRIHNDWVFQIAEDDELDAEVGPLQDGVEFRRLRFAMSGSLYKTLIFKMDWDLNGGDNDLRDAFVGLRDTPLGNLKIGHFREDYSLQEMTSSNHLSFIERPFIFTPDRNVGAAFYDTVEDANLGWFVGAFRETNGFGEGSFEDKSSISYTGRVTHAPIYDKAEQQLVHLGLAYSFRNPDGDLVRYRSRPQNNQAPNFLDTGEISADQIQLINAELATVLGPLTVQGEYAVAVVDVLDGSSEDLSSWYVEASYFLTGESKPYKLGKGKFGNIKPVSPFLAEEKGSGAWELKARYSSTELEDNTIQGGEMQIASTGVNWYLHSNARVLLDYVFADLDSVGESHALQARLAVHF